MDKITRDASMVIREFLEASGLKRGQLLVIGCSSSEVLGDQIGKNSSLAAAEAVFAGIWPVLQEKGIHLAVQCCEHLNRALIMEQTAAEQREGDIGVAALQFKIVFLANRTIRKGIGLDFRRCDGIAGIGYGKCITVESAHLFGMVLIAVKCRHTIEGATLIGLLDGNTGTVGIVDAVTHPVVLNILFIIGIKFLGFSVIINILQGLVLVYGDRTANLIAAVGGKDEFWACCHNRQSQGQHQDQAKGNTH